MEWKQRVTCVPSNVPSQPFHARESGSPTAYTATSALAQRPHSEFARRKQPRHSCNLSFANVCVFNDFTTWRNYGNQASRVAFCCLSCFLFFPCFSTINFFRPRPDPLARLCVIIRRRNNAHLFEHSETHSLCCECLERNK